MRNILNNAASEEVKAYSPDDEMSLPRGLYIFAMGVILFLLISNQTNAQSMQHHFDSIEANATIESDHISSPLIWLNITTTLVNSCMGLFYL